MNRSIMVLAALWALSISAAAGQAPASLDEAESIARLENKLILVDFFTEW